MKLRKTMLVYSLAGLVAGAPMVHASNSDSSNDSTRASKSEAIGVGTGAAIGAAVGGPVGAILGAAIGGHYGDTHHKSNVRQATVERTRGELEASRFQLDESMSAQARLDQELMLAQSELDELNQRIEQLFIERALVNGLQFDVHFDTDDSTLADMDSKRLVRLSELLMALPEAQVELYGFADTRGDSAHNETLSLDRAYTVADALNELGVEQSQIRTFALGESKSTYTGDDIDVYAHDRRVSIRLQLPAGTSFDSELENASIVDATADTSGGN